MPHFVIDCSNNIIKLHSPEEIMKAVYDTVDSTKLFTDGDIKVRINAFNYYNAGNTKNDFIHVFAYIMQGRNTAQKADPSKRIISVLKPMFAAVPVISINISDFEKDTYCNRNLIPD